MRLLHDWLAWLMRHVEEAMISRLLRQRDKARAQADYYRQRLGMKMGEFDAQDPEQQA